jgi:DMSO/TMAO reductase YedYZ molybdopterin-dependent catalytic subunit/thiosulfate reductase cytochrome b subunit
MSGLSIYWASPVYPPGLPNWLYDHASFGRQSLASGLRIHWLFAYLFMACGLLYAAGLIAGAGWRALIPRRGDAAGALAMIRYYLGLLPMRLRRKPWPAPRFTTKYNPLQRTAYASMPLFGLLAIASGWAIHKPMQLWWLERLFGSYDGARVVHYWTTWVFVAFVVPHVVLVVSSGWDTLRSMVIGWSASAAGETGNERAEARMMTAKEFRGRTRRGFLFFGAGALAAAAGFWVLLPVSLKRRLFGHVDWLDTLEARMGVTPQRRERLLRGVLTFDDDVAEALYSPFRRVRTYSRADITPLKNNYSGRTPDPAYLATWKLTLSGLASGGEVDLGTADLLRGFTHREQITRLCCVEGWSAIAWWGGIRFDDLLHAYPPAPGTRWAAMESAVSLDGAGRPDPYYVSIDLPTAWHPQTLLATHFNGLPLTVDHGAPLRLVVPMKLGLKHIKAITRITYSATEPRDYWAERGYSRYDGL